jgi:hypothetical protein
VTFSARDLRPTAHGESMTVDLVPANEAPAAPDLKADASKEQSKEAKLEPKADKPSPPQAAAAPKAENKTTETKAPEAKAPEAKLAQAKPTPTATAAKPTEQKPQQPLTEQKPPRPQPQSAQPPAADPQATVLRELPPDMNRLADMLGLPIGDAETSGTSGARMSKFTEGVKEFKAQVKKCLTLPPGMAPNQRMKMVIRVELTPTGALAQDPAVMDAVNPTIGFPLMQSVIRALRQCAPYSLPADKYKEWRVLDIDFSPDQMMGS